MEHCAERRLLCREKFGDGYFDVTFAVRKPRPPDSDEMLFLQDECARVCEVEIRGLDEPVVKYFGLDSMQAINLASDLEPLVKRLSERFDFFWSTGEPYFDEGRD
jgi:hypothetical protein